MFANENDCLAALIEDLINFEILLVKNMVDLAIKSLETVWVELVIVRTLVILCELGYLI